MDNARKSSLNRLKKVLLNDKTLPSGLSTVLRADLNMLLKGYFDYDASKLSVDINIDASGVYHIVINAPINRIKPIKVL